MNPHTLALFRLTRLLPGKGVQLRGYGDKKTASGLALMGTKGSQTLRKIDSSKGVNLTELKETLSHLRPGAGVVLHGYKETLVLERLPDTIEEVLQSGPLIASLTIERQVKAISGSICIERLSTESPGNYVIKTVTTGEYENGAVTSSVEASGVIQTWEEGETPDACAALIYDSDYDPEFDYGEPEGDPVNDETLVSYADFYGQVISDMLALAETLESGTSSWMPDEWAAASDAMTGWKAVLTPYIGVVGSEGADNCTAGSMRWRAVNDGNVSIQVYWELQKVIDDSVVSDGDFTLGLGQASSWFGPPTALPDLEEALKYKITRVRINNL